MGQRKIKVVFDTNFYISLILGSTICAKIFNLVLNQKLNTYICNFILSEMFKVSSYPRLKKHLRINDVFYLKNMLLLANNIYFVNPKPFKIKLEDKNDQKILETAITSKANFLITRNLKDFAKAKNIQGLKITTPEKFISVLRKKGYL